MGVHGVLDVVDGKRLQAIAVAVTEFYSRNKYYPPGRGATFRGGFWQARWEI